MSWDITDQERELWRAYNLARGSYLALSPLQAPEGLHADLCEALDALEHACDLIQWLVGGSHNKRF